MAAQTAIATNQTQADSAPPAPDLAALKPRQQAQGQERPGELDTGRFYRTGLQDTRQISAAARRHQITGAVGNHRAADRNVRRRGALDQSGITPVQVPLSLARTLPRRVQDLLR